VETAKTSDIPLNLPEALERFGGNKELINQVCREYLLSIPGRIEAMRKANAEGNLQEFYRLVHNLKGVSANLSANNLASLMQELEEMSARDELTGIPDILEQVEAETVRLQKYCQEKIDLD
jgi:HPt (histidine-containing phosphotransfer) domain-containing protein